MAKAILVMDMPENCGKCDCCKNCFCYVPSVTNDKNDVIDYVQSKTKPDWRPLKPMPGKATRSIHDTDGTWFWNQGWNACIDKILGGNE